MPVPNSQLPSTVRDIARLIDHSVLHPTATDDDVLRGAELSLNAGVAAFCTKPYAIDLAYKVLAQSDVAICAVIGFPHGNSPITVKCWEAAQARRGGATEIDA